MNWVKNIALPGLRRGVQGGLDWTNRTLDRLPDSSIWFIAVVLALALRWQCRNFESNDYKIFLQAWYDFIQSHGGVAALKLTFSNYTPPYLYWLTFAATALASWPKVVAIKLFAVGFDFLCAFLVYRIVRLKYPTGRRAIAAFCTMLFLPTLVLNSSVWGQCDIIYTTGVVACVYFLLIQRQAWAWLSLGLGFAFKQQTLFILPLMLMVGLKRRLDWRGLLLLPTIYFVGIVPAWWLGRPLPDLLTIYLGQADDFRNLTKNAANLYQWVSDRDYNFWVPVGLVATTVVLGWLVWRVWRSRGELTDDRLALLAFTVAFLVPYCLPKMHDRYFFMADVLSVVLAFYQPRWYWVPLLMQLSSFFMYTDFLLGDRWVSFKVLSLVLGWLAWWLLKRHAEAFSRNT